MSQKIIKIGSSLGVTLRNDVLKSAGLKHGDNVAVSFNSQNGVIEVQSARHEELNQSVAEAILLVNNHQDELAKLDDA